MVSNPVSIYQQAIERSPAYRAFVKSKTGGIPEVNTEQDFAEKVPFMDKNDYIMQYPVEQLCLDGDPSCAHVWLRSSGTSRKPFFWPRRAEDEQHFPSGMAKLFHAYVGADCQPTLIVIGLALGPWATGLQTSYGFRVLAKQTPGLAVVSPGLQAESVVEVLERLSPMYRRTLLLSYPPFAKQFLEAAVAAGVDIKALNLHLMVGGEGITESWRERMWEMLGYQSQQLDSVWCLYGSTDFGNVGFENPLTIAVSRILHRHGLSQQVFGEPNQPMLFQQIPGNTYFEQVNGELVVSRIQGIPIVRYRSGDHVQFIERAALLDRLQSLGHDPEQLLRDYGRPVPDWQVPFIALFGRVDQMVFFYGANITVEQVKSALNHATMQPYFSGRFLLKTGETDAGDPQIQIRLPSCPALEDADLKQVAAMFGDALAPIQAEFRMLREQMPEREHVKIMIAPDSAFALGWKTRHM